MSNVLRRPMFRGGPVNSYNIGIASGLGDEGYAEGGQIGGGTIAGNLMPDGRYGFQNPRLIDLGGGRPTPTTSNVAGLSTKLLPQSFLDIMESYGKKARPAFNFLKGSAIPLTIAGAPFYMDKDPLKDKPAEEKFQTTAEELQQQYYGQPRRKLMEDIISGTRSKAESPYTGFDMDAANRATRSAEQRYFLERKGQTPLQLSTEEEEITEQAKLYQKLLGGDEAKSQSIYDVLLAASPAFFKGKNLREAAPEVLTAINKSGAFDKPRDIKQAASQLAIQRAMLRDKAVAEERSRLAIYGAKNQETLSETLKNIPGSFIAGPLPEGFKENTNLLRPGGIYSVGNEKFYAVPGDVVDSSGKKKPGVVGLQKL